MLVSLKVIFWEEGQLRKVDRRWSLAKKLPPNQTVCFSMFCVNSVNSDVGGNVGNHIPTASSCSGTACIAVSLLRYGNIPGQRGGDFGKASWPCVGDGSAQTRRWWPITRKSRQTDADKPWTRHLAQSTWPTARCLKDTHPTHNRTRPHKEKAGPTARPQLSSPALSFLRENPNPRRKPFREKGGHRARQHGQKTAGGHQDDKEDKRRTRGPQARPGQEQDNKRTTPGHRVQGCGQRLWPESFFG